MGIQTPTNSRNFSAQLKNATNSKLLVTIQLVGQITIVEIKK